MVLYLARDPSVESDIQVWHQDIQLILYFAAMWTLHYLEHGDVESYQQVLKGWNQFFQFFLFLQNICSSSIENIGAPEVWPQVGL